MSLDLQMWMRGLAGVMPEGFDLETNMRIVDNYIKEP